MIVAQRALGILEFQSRVADVMQPGLRVAIETPTHQPDQRWGVVGGSAAQSGAPRRIAAMTSDLVAPPKARVPLNISNRIAPNAHTSERRVTLPPRACSGLM